MPKGSDYTVDSKEEVRKIGKSGEVETYFRIWATSKRGTYFHVDVPEAELKKADEPLTRRAVEIDSI